MQDARCSSRLIDLCLATQSSHEQRVEAPRGWHGIVSTKASGRAQAERVLHTVLLRRAASAEEVALARGSEEEVAPRAAPPQRDVPSPPHPAVPDFVQVSNYNTLVHAPVIAKCLVVGSMCDINTPLQTRSSFTS